MAAAKNPTPAKKVAAAKKPTRVQKLEQELEVARTGQASMLKSSRERTLMADIAVARKKEAGVIYTSDSTHLTEETIQSR